MDVIEHKERHHMMHKYLDELVADFVNNTGKALRGVTLIEFMMWSKKQIKNPDEYDW